MLWDWSRVRARLVPSLAGKHEGWEAVERNGHPALMKAVQSLLSSYSSSSSLSPPPSPSSSSSPHTHPQETNHPKALENESSEATFGRLRHR